jgi:hypothetical protein
MITDKFYGTPLSSTPTPAFQAHGWQIAQVWVSAPNAHWVGWLIAPEGQDDKAQEIESVIDLMEALPPEAFSAYILHEKDLESYIYDYAESILEALF